MNLALAAVDHFNLFVGLGPANAKREPLAQSSAARAVDGTARAAAGGRAGARLWDGAVVTLLRYTATGSARCWSARRVAACRHGRSPGRGVARMTREQADAIANQIAAEPHGSGPAGGVILRAG